MKQTLHIPGYHPPTVNDLLGNHHKAGRLKKACVKVFWGCCLEQRLVKASGKRLVEIIITVRKSKKGRRPDPDAYYKSALDALVKCNMLVDDSSQWCEHAATLITSGEQDSTTIHLTDIDGLPPGYAIGSVEPKTVRPSKKGKASD